MPTLKANYDKPIKFRTRKCLELIEILPNGDAWVRNEGETDSAFVIPKDEFKNYEKVLIWD